MLNSEQDSYLMQRTDSEATDESPFGSSLTTPVDEEPPPFENIAERLLSQLDLDLDLDLHLERTPRPQYRDFGGDKDKNRSRSLSKAVGVAKKFARGLVYHQKARLPVIEYSLADLKAERDRPRYLGRAIHVQLDRRQ